jgi:hypothetical protein
MVALAAAKINEWNQPQRMDNPNHFQGRQSRVVYGVIVFTPTFDIEVKGNHSALPLLKVDTQVIALINMVFQGCV